MTSWLIPSLISLFCFGIWAFFTKLAVYYIDARSAYIFQSAGILIVALILLCFINFRPTLHIRGSSIAILSGVATGIGCIAYFYATSKGKISTVAAFAALYPIVTIALAFFLLHESLQPRQAAGIVLALIAIYLMV